MTETQATFNWSVGGLKKMKYTETKLQKLLFMLNSDSKLKISNITEMLAGLSLS